MIDTIEPPRRIACFVRVAALIKISAEVTPVETQRASEGVSSSTALLAISARS